MVFKSFKYLMQVIMLVFVAFGAVACSNNFDLEGYKIDGKTKIDDHVETKPQGYYSPEKWAELLSVADEGKQAINKALNKKTVDIFVDNTKRNIDSITKGLVTVEGISNQFDTTELKEYWMGSIDDDFEDDRVVVIMKKTTTYPELELDAFGLSNAESLHYDFFLRHMTTQTFIKFWLFT